MRTSQRCAILNLKPTGTEVMMTTPPTTPELTVGKKFSQKILKLTHMIEFDAHITNMHHFKSETHWNRSYDQKMCV